MPRPDPTKIINMDGRPLLVDDQSVNVKALIELFDHLRGKAYEVGLEKVTVDAALAQVQQQIANTINAEQQQALAQQQAAQQAATPVAPPAGDAANG